MRRNSINNWVLALAVIGSLVLLNVVGVRLFARLDLTKDRLFTLSEASKDAVKELKEPLTIEAYFTEQLPAPYSDNARYLRDLLEEYRSASNGKLSFKFIDPASQETDADREAKKNVKTDIFGRQVRELTEMERNLQQLGIPSVEIDVLEEDRRQTKRAYMGITIKHQEKKEVIPLVQEVKTLEYEITSRIRKLTRAKSPVIALSYPSDKAEAYRALQALLSQNYDVRTIDLGTTPTIADDVDALWVLGPKAALSVEAQKAIDQFFIKGKSVGLFLDSIQVDLKDFNPSTVEHGLTGLLSTYGIQIAPKLVADAESAQLSVQQQMGSMVVAMPVPYPFIPMLVKMEGDNPISRGITGAPFPFANKVSYTSAEGRTYQVMARSSQRSWLESPPFNVDPRRDWRSETITPDGPHELMISATGKFKSHFGSGDASNTSQAESRLLVAGSSSLFWTDFMRGSNSVLALNIADWMAMDSGLMSIRSRNLVGAPIQPELSENTRKLVKWGNLFGVVVLLAGFGIVRLTLRNRRRLSASV